MAPGTTPWWRPDRLGRRRQNLETRGRVLEATRAFFRDQGFLEVETPALQVSPGMEPHLVAFATAIREPGAGQGRPLYLHTSPEFAMKKLLAGGLEKIFQLARVFRNAERSATHHPEFTMLEWYRANAGYVTLMEDCEGLLAAVGEAAGVSAFTWQGRRCDPGAPAERLTVAEAFKRDCGIDLLATTPDPYDPSIELLAEAAKPLGIAPRPGDRWDDLFFRIFLERIEPGLGIGRPTILRDYPVSMAALSRLKAGDPRLCERFELYVCGLELANAFGELTDAAEQRRRFEADMALKQKLYGIRYPIDEDFIAALEHGLPPSAGIALGIDRLVMLAAGADHIEDVLWAPVSGPRGDE
jgi:elongation factor P--(R)-beta-lysine ligase